MYFCDLDQRSRSLRTRSKVTKGDFAYFSETTEATVTKLGTKVPYGNAHLNTHITVTLTEGQGHKGQGQRS